MKKHWWMAATAGMLCFLLALPLAGARRKDVPQNRILYIPHDNRPVSEEQTVAAAQKLGYEVILPPEELLGNRQEPGQPARLWAWLSENAAMANAAVVSSDAMLYGSLVASRKHGYGQQELLDRAERFRDFRAAYPQLPLYVFSSVMRTPRTGAVSGREEPDYYRSYGSAIFRYTLLKGKAEVEGLTYREKKESAFLERLIPPKDLADWLGRRKKNYRANERLIDLARKSTFQCLILGRDDNALYSPTHMEGKGLAAYAQGISKMRCQPLAGIDEIGMLLLARAINDMTRTTPHVFVRYNWGMGANTVPSYSDEKISASIGDAIEAAGGVQASAPEGADLVLAVNTNPDGRTLEAGSWANDGKDREGTRYFADIVSEYVMQGYPVGVADIAFANGSDNALMERLRAKGLLFKLRSYAGWNTATNSTGFALGEGMLAKRMRPSDVEDLLVTRYLDDWAYQANVRGRMARQLSWLRGDGLYGSLDSKREGAMERSTDMLRRFVDQNFPPLASLEELQVTFPWNRLFEAEILHGPRTEAPQPK